MSLGSVSVALLFPSRKIDPLCYCYRSGLWLTLLFSCVSVFIVVFCRELSSAAVFFKLCGESLITFSLLLAFFVFTILEDAEFKGELFFYFNGDILHLRILFFSMRVNIPASHIIHFPFLLWIISLYFSFSAGAVCLKYFTFQVLVAIFSTFLLILQPDRWTNTANLSPNIIITSSNFVWR